jgi:hypothetical protein
MAFRAMRHGDPSQNGGQGSRPENQSTEGLKARQQEIAASTSKREQQSRLND